MKINSIRILQIGLAVGGVAVVAGALAEGAPWSNSLRVTYDKSRYVTQDMTFPQEVPGTPALIAQGRGFFGLNNNLQIDNTLGGLFTGTSAIYGPVTPNGTMCSTCHRPDFNLMLPPPPLSAHVAANDPLFTGRNAEAQGDPRQADLFENHGLLKQRMNRFNPLLRHPTADTSPDAYHLAYYNVFTWRKTQTILNVAFGYGYLTDGRARSLIEQGRGATFTHTQDTDIRFDDIVNPSLPAIAAWQETVIQPPELSALLDSTAPLHNTLVNDPFYTVHPTTAQEAHGQAVFAAKCMSCHNVPNVFGNRSHVPAPPGNFPPLFGQTYDIGVAQRNRWNLDFRVYDTSSSTYQALQLPLTREDGSQTQITVVDDVGSAGTTGRYEDLHRFKVPQLRNIKNLAPYFHDNSAESLEEVVDYFNSDEYNESPDGETHPIHMDHDDRDALIAFLKIL